MQCCKLGHENAVMSGTTHHSRCSKGRKQEMQATTPPPFLGARLLAPSGGERAGPSPGATDVAPSWATSNFGRTDLRRTTSNFFLAYVLNKHHAYHDPSEIDFARPTQASSVYHDCERPLLQAVFRCGRRFRIDPHRPHSLVRGRGQRKKTQGSRTTSEISQITQRRCTQKADAAARGT